ncbi:MAG TPA: RES domain-containing protein [Longimicrobiaceae bacterium]|nr:RES domain-containing protein [Longimicrobiaceae bacterium]
MVQIGRAASFPATGAYRVSPSPWAVFPLTEPGTPVRPVHRFDDPEGGYPVRYLATALRGALIEVLDKFRTVTATEQRLRQVQGVDGLDILAEETAGRVPEK